MDAAVQVEDIRISVWARDYQDYLNSGLTQSEWCKIHNVADSTFRYRNKKIRGALSEVKSNLPVIATQSEFAQVPSFSNQNIDSNKCIRIISGDRTIEIGQDVPEDLFRTLLEVVFNA